jgi:hypothetical protein
VPSRKPAPTTLQAVVAEGDRRRSLEAVRDRLGRAIDDCVEPRDVGSLAKHLSEVLRDLENLPMKDAGSRLDDLAAKRRARGATTSDRERPAAGK